MARLFLFLFLFLFSPALVLAQNTPESDYQYQLSQYRRYYAEYRIYKKDYQTNRTLDNEQKALQSAKSAIIAREITRSSFVRILRQSITSAAITHPLIEAGLSRADELANYYLAQADIAASIQTQKDLAEYNSVYQQKIKSNQISLDILQLTNKLAYLISFRQKLEQQFSLLKPQIEPKANLALVANGLEEINLEQDKINQNLDSITTQLTAYANQDYGQKTAYEKMIYSLSQIQLSERRIAERLIDFDKNYVDR